MTASDASVAALWAMSCCWLAGCLTLAPAGRGVRLVYAVAEVGECQELGPVRARPPYMWPDDWQIQLRNSTGDLGGDTVLSERPGSFGDLYGKAFRCEGAELSAPRVGCTTDNDCKGDRVCEDGACRAL
jgi:hypothetical protein